MAMSEGMGVMPTYNLGENGSGESSWMWIIFLFFLMGWGGNGFGNNSSKGEISNDFLYTNLNNDLNTDFIQVYNQNMSLSKELCNGLNTLNSNVSNGFNNTNLSMLNATNGINNNLNSLSREMSECCCLTNRNIDSVKLENERNTQSIIQNATSNTQAILDRLCQSEIQQLRDELRDAKTSAAICSQNDLLIHHLRPFPIPAYPSCSPYEPVVTQC